MDMRQIRQLLAVVEHGNMLRAAQAIHLSQPALTKSIQSLEAELGVRLLTRGRRGVTPTIYGEILVKHGRLLRNESEQAIAEIRALKEGRTGHLRLGVSNFAVSFLPRVIASLLASKPGLSLEIFDGTYEELTDQVRAGALDALVAGFPPLHRVEDLVHEPLVAGEFLLVFRPDHPLGAQARISVADAAAQRWILANTPRAIGEMVELTFRAAGADPPKPWIECGSMAFLKALLLEGHFVTVLPRGVIEHELATGQLLSHALGDQSFQTQEGIIYRSDAIHPPALFALIEALKREHAGTNRAVRKVSRRRG